MWNNWSSSVSEENEYRTIAIKYTNQNTERIKRKGWKNEKCSYSQKGKKYFRLKKEFLYQ
jgi:hypothetical protein